MDPKEGDLPLTVRYPYYICDVLTDVRFGGNPLAVLAEADVLSEAQMQQIAREQTTDRGEGDGPL